MDDGNSNDGLTHSARELRRACDLERRLPKEWKNGDLPKIEKTLLEMVPDPLFFNPFILDTKPSTFNPRPSTLYVQPTTLSPEHSTACLRFLRMGEQD